MRTGKVTRQLNNKGLTLVEVIIAVVILAIAVAPTLRLLASSTSYNARSRGQQRAIAVAESTMESFKAYHLEDLCLQFGAGSGGTPFKGVSSDSATTRSVTAYAGGSTVAALDSEDRLNTAATSYEFAINDAVQEGKRYDVKVSVSKHTASPVLKMEAVNPYTDAVIQLEESDVTDAFTQISTEAGTALGGVAAPADMVAGGSLSLTDVSVDTLNRKISIKASHDGSTNADSVVLEVTYDYVGSYSYSYVSTTSGVRSFTGIPFSGTIQKEFDPLTHATSQTVYDNSATIASAGGSLQNIYLYYYPLYQGAVGATSASDSIVVDGGALTGNVPVFVAKQKATTCTETMLNTYEAGYHVSVSGSGNLSLHHNLDVCLSNSATIIPAPSISGFAAADKLEEGALETKGLLYDVVVRVYNAGEADEIATFSGTMND